MTAVGPDDEELTRKQRREQARAQRRAMEEAQAASAARRTRLIQLGIVAGVVAVIIAVVVIATSGGSKKGIEKTTAGGKAPPVVEKVKALLSGIPESANTLGQPRAPVTLVFFGDLECPICKDFSLDALPGLIANEVRPGRLKIEYRSLQSATRERETFDKQQIAALAAGKQNKLWFYTELFYNQQGEEGTEYVTEEYLRNLAAQVPGLDIAKWNTDRGDPSLAGSLELDAQKANNENLTGTPSFLLGKSATNAKKFEPPTYTDPSPYYTAVERELKT
jgi:protein-disulfide isomerase